MIPILALNRAKSIWGEDSLEFKCVCPIFKLVFIFIEPFLSKTWKMGKDTRSCCIHTWDMGTYVELPRWSSCLHWLSFRSCRVRAPSLFPEWIPGLMVYCFFSISIGWRLCYLPSSGHLNLNWLYRLKISVKNLLLFSDLWFFQTQKVETRCLCCWNLFNRLIYCKAFLHYVSHFFQLFILVFFSLICCCTWDWLNVLVECIRLLYFTSNF